MKRKHILLPVSVNQLDAAKQSLAEALNLVADDGKITLLNAQEPIPGPAKHYLPTDALSARDAEIKETLRELAAADPRCDVALAQGRAGVVVVEYAVKKNIDCIVMASHKPGLKDYFLGSTTSRVVRYAPCSVYVMR